MPQRQGGLFLVLGGAPSVWEDYAAARAMVGPTPGVIACNHAGIEFKGPLNAWATLHPERMGAWQDERGGARDFPVFIAARHPSCPEGIVVPQRWVGSSGMYVVQIGVTQLQAAGLILCGIPMDPEAGHISYPGRWVGGEGYRKPFVEALPLIGGRVRSMGGWTRDLFGPPTLTWLQALGAAKPFSRPSFTIPTRAPMFTVKNVSETAQKISVIDPRGGFATVWLQPGESGAYDVDPAQARYQPGGPLVATPIKPAKAPKAAKPDPEPQPDVEPVAGEDTQPGEAEA